MRGRDEEARRLAFGDLIEGYCKPVYKHLRVTWRLTPDDAQDVTQGFFADAFQKAWLEKYEPSKARFRTFVRMCADRFVMNRNQSATRLKRGGGQTAVPLDFESAEREIAGRMAVQPEAEAFFHQEFVRALFERAVHAVREEYAAAGRDLHVTLFERYDLAASESVSYADLAREFDLTPAQVTNYLAQVRRSFRGYALETLRGLCGTEEEFRREARELFGVEVP